MISKAENYVDIRWIGEAGFILDHRNVVKICLDPYLSRDPKRGRERTGIRPSPISPEEVEVDYVLITHEHGDHLDEKSIVPISRASKEAIFVGPPSCVRRMKEMGIPSERLREMRRGESSSFDGAKVIAVYADDLTDDGVGYVFDFEGIVLYYTGDNEKVLTTDQSLREISRIRDLYPPHILIVPLVQSDTVVFPDYRYDGFDNTEKDVEVVKILQPRIVIPSHYGTLARNKADPKRFASALKLAGLETKLVEIGYGNVWRLDAASIRS